MKKIVFSLTGFLILLISYSQDSKQESKYNHQQAFDPTFYTQSANEFRSGSGEPGPKYWQNRADYTINSTLDTGTHRVSGEVQISYVNNSPDNLRFLWLQLDQNIYRNDSRASSTTTQSGGRWANAKFTEGYSIGSISVETGGKSYTPKYTVTDTRMQVWLSDVVKSSGGTATIKIKYDFTVPEYGTDRMGRLKTKN